jgi:hypothetical protein
MFAPLTRRSTNLQTKSPFAVPGRPQSDVEHVTERSRRIGSVRHETALAGQAPPSWNLLRVPVRSRDSSSYEQVSLSRDARTAPSTIAAQLAIVPSNSASEREAEELSGKVMNLPDGGFPIPRLPQAMGSRAAVVRRESIGAPSRSSGLGSGVGAAPRAVHEVLKSQGTPLDRENREFFEPRFGQDLSHVRLHTSPRAAASARAIGARAYTVGENIVFGDASRAGPGGHRGLLAHELVHVLQHGDMQPGPGAADTLAMAPDPNKRKESRSVSLEELHDIMVMLLKSLKRSTQLSVMGYKTIAIGLAEGTDETGALFQTLVYTASGNWGSVDLETQAAALGITRWNVRAREEQDRSKKKEGDEPKQKVRGPAGAPEDSEQLMLEGQDAADMDVLGLAVAREPCFDCADALLDAGIKAVFVDPAKHLAKRQRTAKTKPSKLLEQARAEIAQAVMPQAVVPGTEGQGGLGPQSTLWLTLNGLDIKELYQVLDEAESAGHLGAIAQRARLARGVAASRIMAPIDAILLKKENLKIDPDPAQQLLLNIDFRERLDTLPKDQRAFLLRQVNPSLRLAAPKTPEAPVKEAPKPEKAPTETKQTAPKKVEKKETAEASSSVAGPIVKALIAIGVGAAAIELAGDFLALVVTDVVTGVILRLVAEGGLKVTVQQAIKEVLKKTSKEALKKIRVSDPRVRVAIEEVAKRLPEIDVEELGEQIVKATQSYLRIP